MYSTCCGTYTDHYSIDACIYSMCMFFHGLPCFVYHVYTCIHCLDLGVGGGFITLAFSLRLYGVPVYQLNCIALCMYSAS